MRGPHLDVNGDEEKEEEEEEEVPSDDGSRTPLEMEVEKELEVDEEKELVFEEEEGADEELEGEEEEEEEPRDSEYSDVVEEGRGVVVSALDWADQRLMEIRDPENWRAARPGGGGMNVGRGLERRSAAWAGMNAGAMLADMSATERRRFLEWMRAGGSGRNPEEVEADLDSLGV